MPADSRRPWDGRRSSCTLFLEGMSMNWTRSVAGLAVALLTGWASSSYAGDSVQLRGTRDDAPTITLGTTTSDDADTVNVHWHHGCGWRGGWGGWGGGGCYRPYRACYSGWDCYRPSLSFYSGYSSWGCYRPSVSFYSGWDGGYQPYCYSYAIPRVYSFPLYTPAFSSYYGPSYYSSYSLFGPCAGSVADRVSARVLARVPREAPVPSQEAPPPVAVPSPDGTYEYDGGPSTPAPTPRTTQPGGPTRATPTPQVPLQGQAVSLPRPKPTAKFTYAAYGDNLERPAVPAANNIILVKKTGN